MGKYGPLLSLKRVLSAEDFKASPLRAIVKRIVWHWRWRRRNDPWQIVLDNGMSILLPHTGPSALIFYQGSSDPHLAAYLESFLRPGMVFFDVGAHIGEFSLRATKCVGPTGQVHSFEPQPEIAAVFRQSITLAKVRNLTLRECVLSNKSESLTFSIRSGFATSSIAHPASSDPTITRTIKVAATTLDEYTVTSGVSPHLIKIDVEGAEVMVLRGAESLLSLTAECAPVICLEYSSSNYAAFGFSTEEVCDLLIRNGYSLFALDSQGTHPATESDLSNKEIINIVASKNKV
jgi:FkbM family methyltransferase